MNKFNALYKKIIAEANSLNAGLTTQDDFGKDVSNLNDAPDKAGISEKTEPNHAEDASIKITIAGAADTDEALDLKKKKFEKTYSISADWSKGMNPNEVTWTLEGDLQNVKSCVIKNWNNGDFENVSPELQELCDEDDEDWQLLLKGMNAEDCD